MPKSNPSLRASGKKARWTAAQKQAAKTKGSGPARERSASRPKTGGAAQRPRRRDPRLDDVPTKDVPTKDGRTKDRPQGTAGSGTASGHLGYRGAAGRDESPAHRRSGPRQPGRPRTSDRSADPAGDAERGPNRSTGRDRPRGHDRDRPRGYDRDRPRGYDRERPRGYDTGRPRDSDAERPRRNERDRTSHGERPARRTPPPLHAAPSIGPSRHALAQAQAHQDLPTRDNGFAELGLPATLVERLTRGGITTPFPIQAATIPDALAGRDVLGRGRTGSGKTLAFGLPTLARLAADGRRSRPRQPRALVLVPTRELAMQVTDALEPLVHVIGLRHHLVAGGLPYPPQLRALERGVDLLVATPGRLIDLLERQALSLDAIEITILDEADHMAEMGFLPDLTTILDQIPAGGQRLLFSATLDRGVDDVVARYLTDPVTHSTDGAKASITTMRHHLLLVAPKDKHALTAEITGRPGRTVVFVRTKLGADRVALQLREQGVRAAALHGGLSQRQRNAVLGAFRDNALPVLVATDVAARGIHVDDVSLVLQVDPPNDHKDYLHRAGRTARAGESGSVVTFALPHQRRTMERLLRDAGVDAETAELRPGDPVVVSLGGQAPSGVPVPQQEVRRLLEGRSERSHRRPGPVRRDGRDGAADRRGDSRQGRGTRQDDRRDHRRGERGAPRQGDARRTPVDFPGRG